MFTRAMHFLLPFLLLSAAISNAQEKLILSPEEPTVGQSFTIRLDPLPAGDPLPREYDWKVKALKDDVDITTAAAPGPYPNRPELSLTARDAEYEISLTRGQGTTQKVFRLNAASTGAKLVQVADPMPMSDQPDSDTRPMPSGSVVPEAPSSGKLSEVTARLEAAKRWAEDSLTLPKSDDLVVPVDFFSDALAKRADGSAGLLTYDQLSILHAADLHRAMYGAANRFPVETESDNFISAWQDEKKRFIKSLVATDLMRNLWVEFTDRWEREALSRDKERFREALVQAPMIVAGLLLEFEKKHIEAALTGGPPAGGGRTSSTSAGTYYGSSHATRRHHRRMSKIHYRHGSGMTRIRY